MTAHTVSETMSRQLVRIESAATLSAAAREMQEHRIGAVLVCAGDRLEGILTERDVLRAVAAGSVEGALVGDWMTRAPETIEPSASTSLAAQLMIHGGFRHLPVVDGESLVGIVSIRDLVRINLDDETPRGV